MVQFFKGSADPRDAAYGALANALGMGVGQGINAHFANKELEDVLNDPKLKDAPQSEKMQALQSRLSKFGEGGRQLFQDRMQIEQKQQQEKQEGIQKQQAEIFGRILNKQPVTEKERALLSADQSLSLTKHEQQIELQNLKNQGKTTPAADRPIEPDQLNKIQKVRSDPEYEKASPSKKHQMLTSGGVSQRNAEAESKIAAEELKNQPGGEYQKLREKAVAELVSNSFKKREDAEEIKSTISGVRKAINGDIQGPGVKAIIKNEPYGQLFFGLTPDEAALQAENKKLLAGTKGIFPKPTEREIFLLLNSMLPSIGKTKEANLAGLGVIEKANDLALLHADLVDQITNGGQDYVPDLESQVNKRMKPMVDEFHKELIKTEEALKSVGESGATKSGKIKVKSPDGRIGEMTQEQIDAAKGKNVIFTPV